MDRPLETQNYEILSEEAESLLELDERRRHASPIEAGTDARIIEEVSVSCIPLKSRSLRDLWRDQ